MTDDVLIEVPSGFLVQGERPTLALRRKLMADLKGMTVNERLFAMDKVDEFDSAIRKKNEKAAVSILVQCELPIEAATDTVAEIIKEPRKYGY